jgi:polysaccharide pyruvyl transferase WcaK-like protein
MSLSSAQQSRAVGVSLGPFQSVSAEKACAKFLNDCGFVGVRDNKSLAIAQAISPNANVIKTFDLAPLLLCANRYKPLESERKGIALALCPIAINPMGDVNLQAENQRIDDICQLLSIFYKNTGESITLLEFNGHSSLGDWHINSPIIDRLQSKMPLTVKPYNPDPFAVLQDIASYKALISMRLHGSVLGYLAKTPILSLNYHEKCLGWCEQIGLAKDYQFNLVEQSIDDILSPLEQGLTHGFSTPTLAIADALQMALSNWSINL